MLSVLRHSFSNLDFNFETKSLIEIHRDSYNSFLFSGKEVDCSIANVLSTMFPIKDNYGFAEIEYVSHRIDNNVKYSVAQCRDKMLTYSCDLYATFRLVIFDVNEGVKKTRTIRTIKEQEIKLCEMPIMTNNGSFIINGVEKVAVSQIHKSPSVFFNKKIKNLTGSVEYLATIIPYRGSRLEFSYSSNSNLNFRINKKKKMSIYLLLSLLNMSRSEMVEEIYKPLNLFKDDKREEYYYFESNMEDILGGIAQFDVLNENGEVIIKKGTIIGNLIIRKLKNIKRLYCRVEDIKGQYLYREVICNDVEYYSGTYIDDNVYKNIIHQSFSNLCVVNSFIKGFSECVLKSINEYKDFSYEQALAVVNKALNPNVPFVLKEAEKLFYNYFFSETYYSLMKVGRYKLNQVLGVSVPEDCTTLTKDDIIATIKKLILFKNGNVSVDDIDSLSNRRIRSIGELVEMHFRNGVAKAMKSIEEKLNSIVLDTVTVAECFSVNPISKSIKDFFLLSELVQFMEQINMLSELAHNRKISSLGQGGISRDRATSDVRDIHITHYGRICPVETPDGQNIGLINSLASFASVNKYGFIETPYRRVVNGEITDQIDYLDATEEKKYKIGSASKDVISLPSNSTNLVSARYNEDFTLVQRKDLDYIDVAPSQIYSMMASLIPFLESNDTARALMGCNMQRQAVPLLFSETPYVSTGVEGGLAKQSDSVVVAQNNGTITYVDGRNIMLLHSDNSDNNLDVYHLRNFEKTNQFTLVNQKPLVRVGDSVRKGDIIADGASTCNGEVAIGKNILLAFMPWNGYNYEDSVVISKRLVSEDKFTSVHIEEYEVLVRDTNLGAEETTRDIEGISDNDLKYLDESGIVNVGVNVKGGDILVGKLTPCSETPITSEEKLLKAIFGDKIQEKKDTSMRMPIGTFGTVVDVKILTRRGDEKCNRALIIEREEIFKRENQKNKEISILENSIRNNLDNDIIGSVVLLKGKKSKILDKDLNAMSLYQRFSLSFEDKNIGKKVLFLKELYENAKKRILMNYQKDIENIMDGDSLPSGILKIIKVFVAHRSRLQPGDKIAGRHGNKGVISNCVAVEDMPYMEDGTPIDFIFSPVSVPGRMNIGQILETHLGFLSYSIGKKIDNMLQEKNAADSIRKILLDISSDKKFIKKINDFTDNEIVDYGKKCRNGIYFSTPVFDGCKIADMDRIADKIGIDKSLQVTLYDGKTGEPFDRKVTVGYMYIIKLNHLVDDKMHARSTGPYSLITQQPLGGKSYFGGQRLGEMECWALQAYGAAYTLQEMLTVKSDDVVGRSKMYEAIVNGQTRFISGIPESFNVLCREFRSLGFDLELGFN